MSRKELKWFLNVLAELYGILYGMLCARVTCEILGTEKRSGGKSLSILEGPKQSRIWQRAKELEGVSFGFKIPTAETTQGES